jgi:hypothetical protein
VAEVFVPVMEFRSKSSFWNHPFPLLRRSPRSIYSYLRPEAITLDLLIHSGECSESVARSLWTNLGTEGLDREQIDAVYDYLLEVGYSYGDHLQIIVADNTVPSRAVDHVRVQLSDENKLIPTNLLSYWRISFLAGLTILSLLSKKSQAPVVSSSDRTSPHTGRLLT